jgi:hypothetical protein
MGLTVNYKIWLMTLMVALLATIVGNSEAQAQNISEIEQYEVRTYTPINYGLKDLVFEVRVKNLKEILEGQYNLKNIVDIYFKVYWIFPGQYQINVEGLPEGFVELAAELKSILKGKLEFVVPKDISSKLRPYKLSYKSKTPTVIEGVDPTQGRMANRIELIFEESGKLKKFRSFSPYKVTESILGLGIKSWSHNKWVVEEYSMIIKTGQELLTEKNEISYKAYSGVGLPILISTTTTVEVKRQQDGKEELVKLSSQASELTFSKYEVNTGKAKKAMTQK